MRRKEISEILKYFCMDFNFYNTRYVYIILPQEVIAPYLVCILFVS